MERFGALVRWLRVRNLVWRRPVVPLRSTPAAQAAPQANARPSAHASEPEKPSDQDRDIVFGFPAPDPPAPPILVPEWHKPTGVDHQPADIPAPFRFNYVTHYDESNPEHAELLQARRLLDDMIDPNQDQCKTGDRKARSILDILRGPPNDGTWEEVFQETHEIRRWHGQDAIRERQQVYGPFLDRALEAGEPFLELDPRGPPSRWWYFLRPFWTWRQRALFHDLNIAQTHQIAAAARQLYPPERAARVRLFHSFFSSHDPDLLLRTERETRMQLDGIDESVKLEEHVTPEGLFLLKFAEEYEANRLKAYIGNMIAYQQLPPRPLMAQQVPKNKLQILYRYFIRLSEIPHPKYDMMFNQMSWILLRGRLRPVVRTADEIEDKSDSARWANQFHTAKHPRLAIYWKRRVKKRLRKRKKTPHALQARASGRMRRSKWKYWAHIKRSLFDQRMGLPWANPSWSSMTMLNHSVRKLEIQNDRLRRGEVDSLWDAFAAAVEKVDKRWDQRVDRAQETTAKRQEMVKDPVALAAELLPQAEALQDQALGYTPSLFNPPAPPFGPAEDLAEILARQRSRAEGGDGPESTGVPGPEHGPAAPLDPNAPQSGPASPQDASTPQDAVRRSRPEPRLGDLPYDVTPGSPSFADDTGIEPLAGKTPPSAQEIADRTHRLTHERETLHIKTVVDPVYRREEPEAKAEQARLDAALKGHTAQPTEGAVPPEKQAKPADANEKAAPSDSGAAQQGPGQPGPGQPGPEGKAPEEKASEEKAAEEQKMDNNVREVVTAALAALKAKYPEDDELAALTIEDLVIRNPAEILQRTGMTPSEAVQSLNLKPEHGAVRIVDVEEAGERMFELNSPEKGGSLYIQSKFPVAQSVFDLLPQAGAFYIVLPDPPKLAAGQDAGDGKSAAAPRRQWAWQEEVHRKREEKLASLTPEERAQAKRRPTKKELLRQRPPKKPWMVSRRQRMRRRRSLRARSRLPPIPKKVKERHRAIRPADRFLGPKKAKQRREAPKRPRKRVRRNRDLRFPSRKFRYHNPWFRLKRVYYYTLKQRKIPIDLHDPNRDPRAPAPPDAHLRTDLREYLDYRAQFRVDDWNIMTDAEFHAAIEPSFRTKGSWLSKFRRRYVKPVPARPQYPDQEALWTAIQQVTAAAEELERLLAPYRVSPVAEAPQAPVTSLDDLFSNPTFLAFAFRSRDFAVSMGSYGTDNGYTAFPSEARDAALLEVHTQLWDRQLLISEAQGPQPPVQPSYEPNPLELTVPSFDRRFEALLEEMQLDFDLAKWWIPRQRRRRRFLAERRWALTFLFGHPTIYSVGLTRQQMEVGTIEWFVATEQQRAKAQHDFLAAVPAYLAEVERFKQQLASMTPPSQPVPYGVVPQPLVDKVLGILDLAEIKTAEDRRQTQEWLVNCMLDYKHFLDKQVEFAAMRKSRKEQRDAAQWAKYHERAKRVGRSARKKAQAAAGQPSDQAGAAGEQQQGQEQQAETQQEAGKDANSETK